MHLLRRRCGVLTGDLLDTIAGWPADKQHAANQAIKEVEEEVRSSAAFLAVSASNICCMRD